MNVEQLSQVIQSKKEGQQRAQGRKQELMSRLKSEFGCSTVEEGQKLVDDLSAKFETMKKTREEKEREFYEKYPDLREVEQVGGGVPSV